MTFQFSHGGYPKPSSGAANAAFMAPLAIDVASPFEYLFPQLAADPNCRLPENDPATTKAALKELGDAMIEQTPPAALNSTIPPIFTYLGQFIDHDITATDLTGLPVDITDDSFLPMAPADVTAILKNKRRPILDLDSVYGDGPQGEAQDFYVDGVRFKIGTVDDRTGNTPDLELLGLDRDLPRPNGLQARIGDSRNDENLIVAQLHVAFLKFHNAVVDWVEQNEQLAGATLFARAQQLVRWHYQWLVVNDYLKHVTLPGVVDKELFGTRPLIGVTNAEPVMPLEFAVACYRFGHSMVRAEYDHNMNFGRPNQNPDGGKRATFEELFQFTGGGGMIGNFQQLPSNWIIEWDRFTNPNSRFPDHFARKIDTHLAPPLGVMRNEGAGMAPPLGALMKHLAKRNLLRGYLFSLPSAQCLAQALGVPALTATELQEGNSDAVNAALQQGEFLDRTPLWFYVLKEAEVQANGNSLGALGSRIVAGTLVGLLRQDPDSYLNQDWTPAFGVTLPNGDPLTTCQDLLVLAGVA